MLIVEVGTLNNIVKDNINFHLYILVIDHLTVTFFMES